MGQSSMPGSVQRTERVIDERLLLHHPAGKTCLEVCLANGWLPASADVLRLVRLWDAVRHGERSEESLSRQRLEFGRYLRQTGRLSEGVDQVEF